MTITSLMNRRRYSFGRVFWITLAVYLFFMCVGLVAMYVSPAMNTAPNWERIFSWHNLVNQAVSILFFAAFYFVTLNMYHRLFAGKHKAIQFVQPTVIGFLILGVYYAVTFIFFTDSKFELSVNDAKIKKEQLTAGVMIFSYVISSIFIIGFSILIAYLTYLRDEKKQRKVLEEQKMQLEVEKSQANLNFLKAQINPHFLHNTLNFLYAKSLPYSSELSEGILTLSDIMRYALGPAAKDGKVPLKDEIEHVRNVIKINQLRFSNNLNVKFDVNGVMNGTTTIPFMLITIVENAFKHGDLKSAEHPIQIKLDVENKDMHFFCRNKKRPGPKEISTGIGLDNIKKQLDLTYGRNYSLDVKDDNEFYTTELTIKSV
jgi:two-component system LytT family sensor kinase